MADVVCQVISSFSDRAGKNARSKMNILGDIDIDEEFDIAAARAKATSILEEIEDITKLKFEESTLVMPLAIVTEGFKANPVANSSVFEGAWLEFLGEVAERKRRTKVRIWIPSPPDGVLDVNGTKVDKTDALIIALIGSVKDNALTEDGRAIVVDADTGVRQRVTRK